MYQRVKCAVCQAKLKFEFGFWVDPSSGDVCGVGISRDTLNPHFPYARADQNWIVP